MIPGSITTYTSNQPPPTQKEREEASTNAQSLPQVLLAINEAGLKLKFQNTFDKNWEVMFEIAKAESELKTYAYNSEWHKTCQGSYGILQIGCVNYSGEHKDLFDLDTNLRIGKKVLQEQGFKAWSVCKEKVSCY